MATITVFTEGVEGFNKTIAEDGCNGVFIDKSLFEDESTDMKDLIDNISIDAGEILVSNTTLEELQNILAELKYTLEDIDRYNLDQAYRDQMGPEYGSIIAAKVSPIIMRAKIQMEERKSVIRSTYNGMAMPKVVAQGSVIATTEKVAEQDPFFADNMKKAKDLGVKNVFIYGDKIASLERAKAFVRASGYGDVSDIVFIDKRGRTYQDIVALAADETKAAIANIGIRAAANEIGMPSGDSKFLEVQAYKKRRSAGKDEGQGRDRSAPYDEYISSALGYSQCPEHRARKSSAYRGLR